MEYTDRVKGTLNAKRLIKPPEFVESTFGNIAAISLAFGCCEHSISSTNYQCHLETIEVCLSRLQELE
jgi:hypothetical protein